MRTPVGGPIFIRMFVKGSRKGLPEKGNLTRAREVGRVGKLSGVTALPSTSPVFFRHNLQTAEERHLVISWTYFPRPGSNIQSGNLLLGHIRLRFSSVYPPSGDSIKFVSNLSFVTMTLEAAYPSNRTLETYSYSIYTPERFRSFSEQCPTCLRAAAKARLK